MELIALLVALAVVGVVAAVATGRVRGGLDEPTTSRPYRGLPEPPVHPDDVEALRFTPVLRGYRMDEVDEVLDRLRVELSDRDREIADLRARAIERGGSGTTADATTDPAHQHDQPQDAG